MGLFDKAKNAAEQAKDAMTQQTAGVSTGMPSGMQAPDMGEAMKYRDLTQKLKTSGVEAPAEIKAIRRGEAEMGGGIKAEVDVSITPAEGAPYDATIKQSILPSWLDTLDAGSKVSIKYDPEARPRPSCTGTCRRGLSQLGGRGTRATRRVG